MESTSAESRDLRAAYKHEVTPDKGFSQAEIDRVSILKAAAGRTVKSYFEMSSEASAKVGRVVSAMSLEEAKASEESSTTPAETATTPVQPAVTEP